MLLKVGIFLFLLLLPGEGGLLQDGIFGKKDATLRPQLVKVKTITQALSPNQERIIERRLGLVVFELEDDPSRILTDYLLASFSKGGRFRLLYLERLTLPPTEPAGLSPSCLEKMPLIEPPTEIISLPGMARRIGADLAVIGRVADVDKEGRMKLHLRLVDLLSERILLAETIQGDEDEVIREIGAFIQEIYNRFPLLEGEAVFVRGNRININLGKIDGAKDGMEFIVYRVIGLDRLPGRASILGIQTQDIGKIRITQVNEGSSEAEVLELLPLCQIQQGDKVITR